jgi:isoquinoline 1-oxidoreductase subunit beta
LGVLDAAAKLAGWGKPLPAGHGMGIAVHESFKSFVAQVAEVSLDDKGAIRVHRVYCAVDCGKIVNPDTIAAQMESGITFGLSAALYGAITLKNGRVEQSNFDAYPVVRLDAMPRVEVQIVKSRRPAHRAGGGQCPFCCERSARSCPADDTGEDQDGSGQGITALRPAVYLRRRHLLLPRIPS